jgi:hypothetical protein
LHGGGDGSKDKKGDGRPPWKLELVVAYLMTKGNKLNTKFRIIVAMCRGDMNPRGTKRHRSLHPLRISRRYQMLTQLGIVFAIAYPPVYTKALRWIGMINLDLVGVSPFECLLPYNFYTRCA